MSLQAVHHLNQEELTSVGLMEVYSCFVCNVNTNRDWHPPSVRLFLQVFTSSDETIFFFYKNTSLLSGSKQGWNTVMMSNTAPCSFKLVNRSKQRSPRWTGWCFIFHALTISLVFYEALDRFAIHHFHSGKLHPRWRFRLIHALVFLPPFVRRIAAYQVGISPYFFWIFHAITISLVKWYVKRTFAFDWVVWFLVPWYYKGIFP